MEFAKFHSYRRLAERTRSNASLENRKGHDMVLFVEGETNVKKPSKKRRPTQKQPPTTCKDPGVQHTKSKRKKIRKEDDEDSASFSESSEQEGTEDDGSGSSSGSSSRSSDSEANDRLPRGLNLADGSSS